jgi:hypothetical protein
MLIRIELHYAIIFLLLASAATHLTDWRVAFEKPALMLASGSITISAFASHALDTALHPLSDGWYMALYVDGVLQHSSPSSRLVHTFTSHTADSLWIHVEVCVEDSFAARVACSASSFFSVSQRELPDDASQDWRLDAPTGGDALHLGTLGFHALLALPAAAVHVFSASEHRGCFIGDEPTCSAQSMQLI